MSRKELEALGSQRESLSKNPLLIQVRQFRIQWICLIMTTFLSAQSVLGKTKRRCFTLPEPGFIYGAPTVHRDGGVAEGSLHLAVPPPP